MNAPLTVFLNGESGAMALLGIIAVMLAIIIYLMISVSRLRSRYASMMTGAETGADFEKMMLGHIEETHAVTRDNEEIRKKIKEIDALLAKAITRVGVVRFSAFADMGSDLSYAVALLDSSDNGVVMSSIFAREDSRSYVKPITGGRSGYTLTREEEKALAEAISSSKK